VSPDVGLAGSGDNWGSRDASAIDLDDSLTRVVVVSGERGREAAGGLPRLDPDGVWELGSPRIDLLVADEGELAPAHRRELARLARVVDGRRFVVVEPWDRALDLDVLVAWALHHPDVAVGVRASTGLGEPLPQPLLDLTDESLASDPAGAQFPVLPENAWRTAVALVSGSAADLADWAVLGRPAVSIVPEEHAREAGLPLPSTTTKGVAEALDSALTHGPDHAYLAWGRSLHTASDGHAAARVVRAIKATYLPVDEWEAEEESSADPTV
jgi:hypothetical protein